VLTNSPFQAACMAQTEHLRWGFARGSPPSLLLAFFQSYVEHDFFF
jgi:hypothetical protein